VSTPQLSPGVYDVSIQLFATAQDVYTWKLDRTFKVYDGSYIE